jgi:hypothetical protein
MVSGCSFSPGQQAIHLTHSWDVPRLDSVVFERIEMCESFAAWLQISSKIPRLHPYET